MRLRTKVFRTSNLIWIVAFVALGAVYAQTLEDPSTGTSAPPAAVKQQPVRDASTSHGAYLVPDDDSFAQIAVGGVWRTAFFICNMSGNSISYVLSFYDDSGSPLYLPIKQSDGTYVWKSTYHQTIAAFGEENFTIPNLNDTVYVGQGILSYDHSLGQLGGFSIFQEAVPGQPVYEATVPLSGSDYKLYIPFYCFNGYNYGVALANPALDSGANITLTAIDNSGNSMFTDHFYIGPAGHTSFTLLTRYPQLVNTRGNLYITSDSGALSAVGLRFAPGGSYTTVPIMNWTGMFP